MGSNDMLYIKQRDDSLLSAPKPCFVGPSPQKMSWRAFVNSHHLHL